MGGVGKGVAEGVVALVAERCGAAGGGVIGVEEDGPGGAVEPDGAVRRVEGAGGEAVGAGDGREEG